MTRLGRASLAIASILLLVAPGTARSTPVDIHLTSQGDWMDLLRDGGQYVPVGNWNPGLEDLYPGEEDAFRVPQLYLLDGLSSSSGVEMDHHPGLLMAWGSDTEDATLIASWELILPEDPDLTGTCVTLTAWPRTGMTSISFMLQDANGVMKGWTWPVGGATGLPSDQGTTLTVVSEGGSGQAGSTGYFDHGIDLTNIVSFQFAESGVAQPPGVPLPSGLPGFVGQWNYWHDIMVLLCPTLGADGHPNNGFGNGGNDGMPGQSAGRGSGQGHGPIDDVDR